MSTIQSKVDALTIERPAQPEPDAICCYLDAEVSRWTSLWTLAGERLLAAQALQLLMRLDRKLREARADWNQDRFRRVMRARANAVTRVRRRWSRLDPPPAIGLGTLRRRYHANLAGYLYENGIGDTNSGK
jgi:glutathione S-transferase